MAESKKNVRVFAVAGSKVQRMYQSGVFTLVPARACTQITPCQFRLDILSKESP
jgi:hypothetical protein